VPVRYDRPTIYDEGKPIPAVWDLRCTSCGYSLTGLASRRCPECGQAFDPRRTWEANQEQRGRTGMGELQTHVSGFLHTTETVLEAVLAVACLTLGFWKRGAWLAVLIVVLVEANIRIARADPFRYRLLAIACCLVIGGITLLY
jgi:hypothetical protein